MRQYRTDYWQWGVMAVALWAGYLAWDRFTERYGVMWLARDIIEEGRPVRLLRGPGLNRCTIPALNAALVATAVAWLGQAIMVRLGFCLRRAPDSALHADYDDKQPSQPPADSRPSERPDLLLGILESAAEALVGAGFGTVGHAVLWTVTLGRWSPYNGRDNVAINAGLVFWAAVGVGLMFMLIWQEL